MPITDQVKVHYGYTDIFGSEGNIHTVIAELKTFNLWAVLMTLSKLSLVLGQTTSSTNAEQIKLLASFFSIDTRKKIVEVLKKRKDTSERDQWLFFSEPPLLTLFGLAIVECPREQGIDTIGSVELEKVGKWLLILGEKWTRTGDVGEGALKAYRLEGMRRYFARQYFLNKSGNLLHEIARIWLIFQHCKKDSERLDLEALFQESTGVTLREYLYFAFSLMLKWKVNQNDIDLDNDVIRSVDYFRDTTLPKGKAQALLDLFLLQPDSYEELNQAIVSKVLKGKEFQNNFMVFMQRPLIGNPNGTFICISPGLLAQRGTDGMYWRMNEYLSKSDDKKRLAHLPEIWGRGYEDYVNERFTGAFSDSYLANFSKDGVERADGLILGKKFLAIVEIKYAHWSYVAKLDASRAAMKPVLSQLLGDTKKKKGLGQIASLLREIDDINIEGYTLPDKILPIIVAGDGIPSDSINRRYYEAFAASQGSVMNDDRTLPFIILDTEEVELIEGVACHDPDQAEALLLEYSQALGEKNHAGIAPNVFSFKNHLSQKSISAQSNPSLVKQFNEIADSLQEEYFRK